MISETARGRGGSIKCRALLQLPSTHLTRIRSKKLSHFCSLGPLAVGAWGESGRRLRTGRGDIGI